MEEGRSSDQELKAQVIGEISQNTSKANRNKVIIAILIPFALALIVYLVFTFDRSLASPFITAWLSAHTSPHCTYPVNPNSGSLCIMVASGFANATKPQANYSSVFPNVNNGTNYTTWFKTHPALCSEYPNFFAGC